MEYKVHFCPRKILYSAKGKNIDEFAIDEFAIDEWLAIHPMFFYKPLSLNVSPFEAHNQFVKVFLVKILHYTVQHLLVHEKALCSL